MSNYFGQFSVKKLFKTFRFSEFPLAELVLKIKKRLTVRLEAGVLDPKVIVSVVSCRANSVL